MSHPIVLTGATGSLGGHLAHALLAGTDATLHCLVRAPTDQAAGQRLRTHLRRMGPLGSGERLVAVAADIREPRLGLSARRYAELAEQTREVHHCAAHVHMKAPYRELAPANVGGTRHLLDFTHEAIERQGTAVAFHHVSSASVFMWARNTGLAAVDERTEPTMETAGPLGYTRSKVAAEREVRAAGSHGVPTAVYRPAMVVDCCPVATVSSSDILAPLVRAIAALGLAPAGAGPFPLETAEEVARQIVALSRPGGAPHRVRHLFRREPVPLKTVVAALRGTGTTVAEVPVEDWLDALAKNPDEPDTLPLRGVGEVGNWLLGAGTDRRAPVMHSEATWRELGRTGYRAAPLDDAYLERYARSITT
ncbi:SDR family oxidoreductase [Streptomyces murinus]|uniref:SDR family oxidoreductase n=1 Tax=Streptomyces murinus TaxID=33900 RepID=UPI000A37D4EA|nr:SDR family oxidoreductase [Streptomyces murinus]